MLDKILSFIERYFIFTSYVIGFNMWVWNMDILTKDFLYFLILSPLLATFTGMVVILIILTALVPIVYTIDIFKGIFYKCT